MDTGAISSPSAAAQQTATAKADFSSRVLRKMLDTEALQADQLLKMADQSAGIGTTIDTRA